MLGNEAAVQGILEAGISFITGYPGSPSTEIQKQLYKLSQKGQVFFRFALNEKIALENAAAASLSGVRSAVIQKHVGLNVASDAFMTLAYFDFQAALVIIVVDDPGCLSSQNEQDSRLWGKFAHLPILEPSNVQEVKDYILKAVEIAEKYDTVSIVRLTHLTALSTAEVEYTPVTENLNWKGSFVKNYNFLNPERYQLHKQMHDELRRISLDEAFNALNAIIGNYDSKTEKLIVTHGSAYPIVKYMNEITQTNLPILNIRAIHPLNNEQINALIANFKYIYFIEELESYLEDEIASIIGHQNLDVKIYGKKELEIPEENRLIPDVLHEAFLRIKFDPKDTEVFEREIEDQLEFLTKYRTEDILIPKTIPQLCIGCPHRGAYQSIQKAIDPYENVIPSDVGCYSLGQVPPIEIGDFWLCMGGSIGTAIGFSLTNDKPVIAIIGDGTFFHAGISPLIEAVLYNHNITIAILNNSIVAMTGGQPSPTSKEEFVGKYIDLEEFIKRIGVDFVRSVNVENVRENARIFKKAIAFEGPAVVIFNGICAVQSLRKGKIPKPSYIDQKLCTKCGNCLIDFACPAINKVNNQIIIDEITCLGCKICHDVCSSKAIKSK
jgi:indolepyruvate ferredoxin oxidoreductase alpha subunit